MEPDPHSTEEDTQAMSTLDNLESEYNFRRHRLVSYDRSIAVFNLQNRVFLSVGLTVLCSSHLAR